MDCISFEPWLDGCLHINLTSLKNLNGESTWFELTPEEIDEFIDAFRERADYLRSDEYKNFIDELCVKNKK